MCEISIVVPVYNVEKYLQECINSILAQSFTNFELILVDDGSDDRSGEICDIYSQKDARVKVIHKSNGGLSSARNAGIHIAKGEYIGFVDSDDCIEKEMFTELYKAVRKYQSDIAVCSFAQIDENGRRGEQFSDFDTEMILSRIQAQEKYFQGYAQSMIYTVAWNKLYRRSLFENMEYPIRKVHEDEFVTFRLLYNAKNIVYIPYCGYLYRCRNESIMDQFNEKRFHLFDAYIVKLKYFEKISNEMLWNSMLKKTIHMFEEYQYRQKKSGKTELEKTVEEYRKKIIKQYQGSKLKMSRSLKIETILFSKFPALYFHIWKKMAHKS